MRPTLTLLDTPLIERILGEAADLLFHLLVALQQRGVAVASVMDELRRRRERDTRAGRSEG